MQSPPLVIRLLKPGDEDVVRRLADDNSDFELHARAVRRPLSDADTASYLNRDEVLHWVAMADDRPVGHMLCYIQHRRHGDARQLMLYEIGVRSEWRRKGVGRMLLEQLKAWMLAERVSEVWVLADPDGPVDFYRACGFAVDEDQPVQMSLTWPTSSR